MHFLYKKPLFYLFCPMSWPSNEKRDALEAKSPPVSNMLSQELKSNSPLRLTMGLELEVKGKAADKISFSLGCDTAGKKALNVPSMLDLSASLWHNKSAPLTPPNLPDRFSFKATNLTLSSDLNDTEGGGGGGLHWGWGCLSGCFLYDTLVVASSVPGLTLKGSA